MAGIDADHTHDATSLDDLTFVTDFFDARADLHFDLKTLLEFALNLPTSGIETGDLHENSATTYQPHDRMLSLRGKTCADDTPAFEADPIHRARHDLKYTSDLCGFCRDFLR